MLVRRCQAGDSEAFAVLFHRHAEMVLRTAYLLTGSRPVAEEVMQETFLQAFRFMRRLRDPGAVRTWLYRIAVRLARKAARRERTQRQATGRYAAAGTPAASAADGAEVRQVVRAAMARLSPQQRAALVVYYYLDRPVDEVAAILDAPAGTVKAWLFRGRAALAAELGGLVHPSGGETGRG